MSTPFSDGGALCPSPAGAPSAGGLACGPAALSSGGERYLCRRGALCRGGPCLALEAPWGRGRTVPLPAGRPLPGWPLLAPRDRAEPYLCQGGPGLDPGAPRGAGANGTAAGVGPGLRLGVPRGRGRTVPLPEWALAWPGAPRGWGRTVPPRVVGPGCGQVGGFGRAAAVPTHPPVRPRCPGWGLRVAVPPCPSVQPWRLGRGPAHRRPTAPARGWLPPRCARRLAHPPTRATPVPPNGTSRTAATPPHPPWVVPPRCARQSAHPPARATPAPSDRTARTAVNPPHPQWVVPPRSARHGAHPPAHGTPAPPDGTTRTAVNPPAPPVGGSTALRAAWCPPARPWHPSAARQDHTHHRQPTAPPVGGSTALRAANRPPTRPWRSVPLDGTYAPPSHRTGPDVASPALPRGDLPVTPQCPPDGVLPCATGWAPEPSLSTAEFRVGGWETSRAQRGGSGNRAAPSDSLNPRKPSPAAPCTAGKSQAKPHHHPGTGGWVGNHAAQPKRQPGRAR